jgi:hypothetical protein
MPSERGTPPLNVQSTPVPAQVMHFNRPRRFMWAAPNGWFSSRSAISLSRMVLCGANPDRSAAGFIPEPVLIEKRE